MNIQMVGFSIVTFLLCREACRSLNSQSARIVLDNTTDKNGTKIAEQTKTQKCQHTPTSTTTLGRSLLQYISSTKHHVKKTSRTTEKFHVAWRFWNNEETKTRHLFALTRNATKNTTTSWRRSIGRLSIESKAEKEGSEE